MKTHVKSDSASPTPILGIQLVTWFLTDYICRGLAMYGFTTVLAGVHVSASFIFSRMSDPAFFGHFLGGYVPALVPFAAVSILLVLRKPLTTRTAVIISLTLTGLSICWNGYDSYSRGFGILGFGPYYPAYAIIGTGFGVLAAANVGRLNVSGWVSA